MSAHDDMQIMCFGDVYVPAPVEQQPAVRSSLDEDRIDSSCNSPTIPSPAASPRPAHAEFMATASPPSSPCRSSFHRRQASDSSKSSIRSFFSPASFKGKLVQCLLTFLLKDLTLAITGHITSALQIFFILLVLALGILVTHSLITLLLTKYQRPGSVLPITENKCEASCNHCKQRTDTLPKSDTLYAPHSAIRVHLTRDEELKAAKMRHSSSFTNSSEVSLPSPPPAYGAWRCSVRADPNLLHWQRVGAVDGTMEAGDGAAVAEPEYFVDVPISPTLAQTGDAQQPLTENQRAVRVSMIGRAKPAVVNIRTSGNWEAGSGQ